MSKRRVGAMMYCLVLVRTSPRTARAAVRSEHGRGYTLLLVLPLLLLVAFSS